jgi:hypothetical protein
VGGGWDLKLNSMRIGYYAKLGRTVGDVIKYMKYVEK